jgi:hypothetical protein
VPAERQTETDVTPQWVIWLCLVAGHIVALMVLSILWSPPSAFAFVIFVSLIELAVWQRKNLVRLIEQVKESETTKRVARQVKDQIRSTAQSTGEMLSRQLSASGKQGANEAPISAEMVPASDDELVEIQAASVPSRRPQTIPAARRSWNRRSMWSHLTGQTLNAKLPTDSPRHRLPTRRKKPPPYLWITRYS